MVFRRRNSLRPVNSRKHVIDEQGALAGGTQVFGDIADAVDSPALATAIQVQSGCTINSIFLNLQVAATATNALANVYMMIYKNPGSNIGAIPNANVIGTSDFKKMVFHQEMIMIEKNSTGIPRTLFKGVLLLPRHMRRFGSDDKMSLGIFSPGINMEYCFQCIYKEFR